ncbi:MAG TPA: UDP-N-acetylmuramoyl-tripeptide--D-alanyl-D-alanine ligase [Bryobacteraceae bacterium]|nr:UDP-N-acetylmuramoyl-tripeptide--D-alanyl-D-alanine ligase [Bryobacteraceae bacterium]
MILPLSAVAAALLSRDRLLASRDREGAVGAQPLPHGRGSVADCQVTGWSVDTRTLVAGDLFFALRGPSHDGHAYVALALEKGAAGVVVEHPVSGDNFLLVPDTLAALQNLAAWARQHWAGRIVGVTGSAGKTTAKDAIAHLLAVELPVGKTVGNLNNHVGLPLSMLRLPDESRVGVLEMGMNHAGEIRALAAIAKPDIGVVTNVGYAHVEAFDSIEGVALAKRELIDALDPQTGIAVLNADDPRALRFREIHPGRTITFGLSDAADVRATDIAFTSEGTRFQVDGVDFQTTLAGSHGVLNLLAGIAVARAFEIPVRCLREAVATFTIGKMRGERLEYNGVTIWNDCYNSNPEAARAMLEVLRSTPARRHIAVLGEMLELGHAAEFLHRQAGRCAAESGLDALIAVQGAARFMAEEAVRAGMPPHSVHFFERSEGAAGEFVRQLVQPGDAILFKGSRGVQIERAMEKVLA